VTSPLVDVRRLSVIHPCAAGAVRAVRDVTLEIAPGETLALVGESGSGKTTLALALAGLLDPPARIEAGEIFFDGADLRRADPGARRQIAGKEIGMVFQDPRASLNPVLTAGEHLVESLRAHARADRRQESARVIELLREVGIPAPERTRRCFPFELSGGMCQRLAIALALCHRPKLLVADEPTSALDPTIARQVLELLDAMRRRHRLTLLLVTHELDLVSRLADRVAVMYAGRLVEAGGAREIVHAPSHPYTRALLACALDPRRPASGRTLPSIPGSPPPPGVELRGCAFAPRCPRVVPECTLEVPAPVEVSREHWAACIRTREEPENAATP
jgi:oligopeptide/dipeptide ABC transporter ATP-binding protein